MRSKTMQILDQECFAMEQKITFLEDQLREARKENIALLNSQIKHNDKMAANQFELVLAAASN